MYDKRYQGLDSEFRAKLDVLEQRLAGSGIRVRLVCGYRSVEEQNRLYALGRTKPGRIVTNARGGYSWHNFGLAADYAFVVGGQLTWNGPWKVFGRIARECGLEWGGDWKRLPDRPHVQWRKGKSLRDMRQSLIAHPALFVNQVDDSRMIGRADAPSLPNADEPMVRLGRL